MRGTLLIVPSLALAVAAGLSAGIPAVGAPGDASTTVTIKAEGTDLSGVVTSSRPKRCAADRVVVVIKQKGARGGGDDVRFATDTASLEGGVYRWSTGNTGTEGRFYARVRHITGCTADTSPTIRATRNP
jgi:hypothetical protein